MTDSAGGTHIVTEQVVVHPPEIDISYPDGFESLHRRFSTPDNSHVVQYVWSFGDGTVVEGRTVDHTYSASGNYTVTLTLTLDDGSTITSQEYPFVGPGTRYIPGHTIYNKETWYAGGTYVVQGSITVAPGATLTIESGVEAQIAGSQGIVVDGTLKATGVTFTWADGLRNWSGIQFTSSSPDSKLENCVLEHASGCWGGAYWFGVVYAQNSSPTITGCTINNCSGYYGISLNSSSSVVSNNTITGFSNFGLQVSGSSPTVTGNTFSGNGYGIVVGGDSGGTYSGNTIKDNTSGGINVSYSTNNPVLSGNSYSNNTGGDLVVSGTITNAVTWGEAGDVVYTASSITVANGASLTIASGRTIKLNGNTGIVVDGTLKATGVTFTWADGLRNWSGIQFTSSSSDCKLDNCTIEHASGCWGGAYWLGVVYAQNSSPTITWCTINNCSGYYGISLSSSSSVVSNNTITGFSAGNGLTVDISSPTVTGNTFSGNQYGIVVGGSSGGTYSGNTISGNASYGLYYSGTPILNASNNDWGSPTGPLDDSDDRATGGLYNPNGLGNRVSDHVNYDPWIGKLPLTLNALTPAPTSPATAGSPVVWTATATGGISPYQYRFLRYGPDTAGAYVDVQTWGPSDTCNWTPTTAQIGNNYFQVKVRNSDGTGAVYMISGMYKVQAGAVSVSSLNPSPTSPATVGGSVTWTAAASGGYGNYQYSFWRMGPDTAGAYVVAQGWGASNTWNWTPAAAEAGVNYIMAKAKNSNNTGAGAYAISSGYKVNSPAITITTFGPSPSSPVTAGATVTWSATATGGSGSLQYSFWRMGPDTGNTYVSARTWGTITNYSWDTTGAATGIHYFMVKVKNLDGTGAVYSISPGFKVN